LSEVESASACVNRVRAAFAALLHTAGVDPAKIRASARLLDLNRGLMWRVAKVVQATDDATAALNIPGRSATRQLLEASRKRGSPAEVIRSVLDAVREFEAVVERQSGDRKMLAVLLANADTEPQSDQFESARREMFNGACAVWGVRARVRLRTVFLWPGARNPDTHDVLDVVGYVGFQRLRAVAWPVAYQTIVSDAGARVRPEREPVDPDGIAVGDLAFINAFCSSPLPQLRALESRNVTRYELPVGPVGNTDITTCVFGSISRNIWSRYRTEEDRYAAFMSTMSTPVERTMIDVFAHRDLELDDPPEVILCDRLTRPQGYDADDVELERLPLVTQPRRLGQGIGGTVTSHVPWYSEMIDFLCRRIGSPRDDFIGYRCEMTYPPIPTALLARFPLPPAPGS